MKILIRTPNWLGDLLMSTAFVDAVLRDFPEAQVDLIVKAGFETLPLPHRGKVHSFDRKVCSAGAFGACLRAEQHDRIYILPPSFSSAWMAFRAGVPGRFGLKGNGRSWLLNPAVGLPWQPRSRHLVEEYTQLLGPGALPGTMRLAITEAWLEAQSRTLPQALPERFVALAPGAIYGPAKEWPPEHFQELSRQLVAQGWPVVLLGTPDDREVAEQIRNELPEVHNWCGKTNLPQLVAVLYQAALLVSNDSGAMHVMSALQRPQVALFGSTSSTRTGPPNPHARQLSLNLECSPCFKRVCPLGHTNCQKELHPELVFQSCLEALREETKK
ncbi:MAG: lipopolysaccharide heptosyltransferase II [bacterium]